MTPPSDASGISPRGAVSVTLTGVPPRLRWRCRRGMRELDVVLASFLEHGFGALDEADIALFESFLELQDPQLHAYLCGREQPENPALARLVDRIRHSHTPAP